MKALAVVAVFEDKTVLPLMIVINPDLLPLLDTIEIHGAKLGIQHIDIAPESLTLSSDIILRPEFDADLN